MTFGRDQAMLREAVWRQLIDYIDGQDYFFPVKIRREISQNARPVLEEFIAILKEREMVVEFKRAGLFNRVAHWVFTRLMKKRHPGAEKIEVYAKGRNWKRAKSHTYAELAGFDAPDGEHEVAH